MSDTYEENPHSTAVRGIVAELRERLEKTETHPLGPTYVRMDLDYATRDLERAVTMLDKTNEDADFDPCDECEEKDLYIKRLKGALRRHKIEAPSPDFD